MEQIQPAVSNSFEKAGNPQHDCTLLQLPVELREKIWRYLFKSDTPLITKLEFDMLARKLNKGVQEPRLSENYEKLVTSLTSQVLAACQQVYLEGRQILYGENTLCIYCVPKCHILDQLFPMPPQVDDVHASQITLWDNMKPEPGHISSNKSRHRTKRAHYGYYGLASFETYHLTIDGVGRDDGPTPDGVVAVVCRMLRELLYDKQVSIFFTERRHPVLAMNFPYVACCKSLRCKSVTFEGPDDYTVSDVAEVITGDEPFYDTFTDYVKAMAVLRDGSTLTPSRRDELGMKFKEAAITYDHELFERLKMDIIRDAIQKSNELLDYELQDAMMQKKTRDDAILSLLTGNGHDIHSDE